MLIKVSVREVHPKGDFELRCGTATLKDTLEALAMMMLQESLVIIESVSSQQLTLVSRNDNYLERLRDTYRVGISNAKSVCRYTLTDNSEHFTTQFRALLGMVSCVVIAKPELCSQQAKQFVARLTLCQ